MQEGTNDPGEIHTLYMYNKELHVSKAWVTVECLFEMLKGQNWILQFTKKEYFIWWERF